MKKLIRDYLLQYLMITAGAILAAFALEEFLVPNTVLDGGITGISIILNQLTLQPISIFIIVLNLPFLLLGFQQLGKRFFVSGIYGMVIFTVFLEVFAEFQNATSSELLAVVFGGVLLGVGVGLVLRSGGCGCDDCEQAQQFFDRSDYLRHQRCDLYCGGLSVRLGSRDVQPADILHQL